MVACAIVGLVGVTRFIEIDAPNLSNPDASLRAIATQHLGSPQALDELKAVLQSIPPSGEIYYFGPPHDWGSSETLLMTMYLGWNHKVWQIGADGGKTPPPPVPLDNHAPKTFFFYGMEPPPPFADSARRIGSKLYVVSDAAAQL